jgi:predicted porin
MNKKISAAVASAALVLGSSAANAGIIIPAGEWTLDVNGNVNVYATFYDLDQQGSITGGIYVNEDDNAEDKTQSINTGLLPAWLGFTGTTRQNDLDVSFTISMQPNVSDNGATGDGNGPLWRQAFLTFGDKSWGSIKMGKDLGIFAGNAILSDMTLLGVGSTGVYGNAGNSGNPTTLGGIGTGYIYPAWKGQITYTTPNFNGFTAKVGITNPNQSATASVTTTHQDRFGVEGQVEYAFSSGKVWVSALSMDMTNSDGDDWDAEAIDVGVNFNMGNFGLTAYYYVADGYGTTLPGLLGATSNGSERESDGGYVQATYVMPTGTKIGAAYGISTLDLATGEGPSSMVDENKRWTIGAYHPLTKHLNLVAEYNKTESEAQIGGLQNETDSLSVGAILFF